MKLACRANRVALATVTLMLLLAAAESRADLIYGLRFDQPLFEVNPGSTLTVGLILSEQATNGDVNRLGFHDVANGLTFGLTTAEMDVRWDAGGAFVANTSDVLAGTGFTKVSGSTLFADHGFLKLNQADVFGSGVVGVQVADGLHEIRLGELRFTIPGNFANETTIEIGQETIGSSGKDFAIRTGPLSTDRIIIDAVLTSGSSVITAVPEPGTLALGLLGVASVGGVALMRRRRQHQVHYVAAN